MAVEENTSLSKEKCSHQKNIDDINSKLECLKIEKNEVLTEIKKLEGIVDDYQHFYDNFGACYQTNAVTIMVEKELNEKWNSLDSLNLRVDKIRINIEKFQSEMILLKESCKC